MFGGDCAYVHLMCFYHLIAKVVEPTKTMAKEVRDAVLRDIHEIHYSRSPEDMAPKRAAAEKRWSDDPLLKTYHAYFKRFG